MLFWWGKQKTADERQERRGGAERGRRDRYRGTWALGQRVTGADPENYEGKEKKWNLEEVPRRPERGKGTGRKQTGKQGKAGKRQLLR
ncbi:hypothetical protein, partial [Bacillus cereus]|uniref:hypothetical protein n=1 Tax=Bacillus cereus TaxID=1396 RepID=UPI0012B5828A